MDIQKPQNIARMFRIGFDCHETFLDIARAVQRHILRKYKIDIPLNEIKRCHIVDRYLPEEEFDRVLDAVVARIRYARHINEVNGATEAFTNLKSDGHFVELLTSSSYDAHIATIHWLKRHNLVISTRSLGRFQSKGIVAKDYDVILEDNPEQAIACYVYGTPFVFLLTTPTNELTVLQEGIVRVSDLETFCNEVRALSQRLFITIP
jgi:hypothetical protein